MDSIKRNYKDILIAILIMGILSMTIIYANFTRRLIVRAQTGVNSTKWDVHFENLVLDKDSTTAEFLTQPTILEGNTIIKGFDVLLKKPGDHAKFKFDIYNGGEIDAKLSGFVKGNPICTNNDSICNYIRYIIQYSDGSTIAPDDVLKKNERKTITIDIILDKSVASMPKNSVKVSNLSATFYYSQK